MSEAMHAIQVDVRSSFLPEQSLPEEGRFVFAYTIRIHNRGSVPARLISRHWLITDDNGKVVEVRGEGVVGEQPWLRPGEDFEYTSGAVLETGSGTMQGSYQMLADDGTRFEAEIAPFALTMPRTLHAASLDEAITRDLCRGFYPGEPAPDVIVCVVDATNLRLHLRFALEVRALGKPMVLAVNMMDAAKRRGIEVDLAALERELDVPVVPTVAVQRHGAQALVAKLDQMAGTGHVPAPMAHVAHDPEALHAETRRLLSLAVSMPRRTAEIDDALDRWLLHPIFGLVALGVVMFLIFQAVYAWATPVMDLIDASTAWLAEWTRTTLPAGPLNSLLADGIISGVGGVIVFLPQILVLFLFILALEESGYLPRAAFLLDRMMASAGLSGRSFIPLLSSFACAIPGIMATRSIQDPRDRLATIIVAPLMTCSARLPVYALLIGAFIPQRPVGWFNLQGLVLFALYAVGILSALAVAWVMKKWRRDKSEHPLM